MEAEDVIFQSAMNTFSDTHELSQARHRFTHSTRLAWICPSKPPLHKEEDLLKLCTKTQFYTIYSRGFLLHLSISLGVLGLKNVEDP